MATYNFPNITPTSQTFELVTNTKMFQSPLSNAIQTVSRKGSYWKTSMVFNNLSGAERSELQAFIAKLDGQTHRMRIRDYGAVRYGNATPPQTPLVQGSGQSGSSITLDGASANITDYFAAGDYISFNNELHIVTEGADSNVSGVVEAFIAPPIRKTPSDNAPIEYSSPYGVFMMTNNPMWQTQAPYFSSITIEAIEDVLA
jgi:hypothetical protein